MKDLKEIVLIAFVLVIVCGIVIGAALAKTAYDESHAIATKSHSDKWGMHGTQDEYVDWPYPPLRTNLTRYTLIPNTGILYEYYCNDGRIRWSLSRQGKSQ